ncbi:MAG TPA: DUF502 domain-containing protein [Arachidicoccus soli]|uniref:DUF502 domain-containing protein n=1 Tax=Arachidicoccus soli TaxID=2341117 RepID=A0A386HU07_9BACT|nr:DUF502 domain-containing protein [Arachidicoccus soli]AYD48836.1 DUF502 domain-containing protein [Arachidicoccus soli]HEU0228089.1 DUF502 domain-containing protein [Arachidicoccus soli]
MNNSLKATLKKAFRYFFQGVIVIAPIAVTLYFVFWLFESIDNLLPNLFGSLFPGRINDDSHIPGVGFLLITLIMIFIGWASSSFVFGQFIDFLGSLLGKTPGIKLIYSSVKDFLKAFSGNEKKFDRPVLVNVDGADVWRIGFITQNDASQFDMLDHVVVYVPISYAISGITYIVPRDKTKLMKDHIPSTDAMKFVISGGVTEL